MIRLLIARLLFVLSLRRCARRLLEPRTGDPFDEKRSLLIDKIHHMTEEGHS